MEIPQALKETLEIFSPKVVKNSKVAKNDTFPVPYGLRIDTPKVPKQFWPRMPASAARSEDSTVPRVVTASTLIGCMVGATYVYEYALRLRDYDYECTNYYHISVFDFDYCLLPNKNLVYDAEDTQEQWLVPYSKETAFYEAKQIGEIFLAGLSSEMKPNAKANALTGVFFMSVLRDPGVAVTTKQILGKGFYKLEIDMTRYNMPGKRMRFDDASLVEVTPVDEKLYGDYRKLHVKKGY